MGFFYIIFNIKICPQNILLFKNDFVFDLSNIKTMSQENYKKVFESEVMIFIENNTVNLVNPYSYIDIDIYYVSAKFHRKKDPTNVLEVLRTYKDNKLQTYFIYHNFIRKYCCNWKTTYSNDEQWQYIVQKFFFNPIIQVNPSNFKVRKLFDLCFYQLSSMDQKTLRNIMKL